MDDLQLVKDSRQRRGMVPRVRIRLLKIPQIFPSILLVHEQKVILRKLINKVEAVQPMVRCGAQRLLLLPQEGTKAFGDDRCRPAFVV